MVYLNIYDGAVLPFDRGEALRYFGYSAARYSVAEAEAILDECLPLALRACTYRVAYASFPVDRRGDEIDLGFTRTDSKDLARNLEDCRQVVAFAATAGMEIDRLIARYEKISPARAYAFQAIGAERVESLCNYFNAEIKSRCAREGKYLRPRFSCGYGDFPLEKQKDFIAALDCNRKLGVTLNDSLLMSPSKSVTAVIGISDRPPRGARKGCAACNREDCAFRREE